MRGTWAKGGAVALLMICLAGGAWAQTVPPDTLKAAPDRSDEVYERCVTDLRALDTAAAKLDSLIAIETDSRDERALLRVGAVERFEEIQALLDDVSGRLPGLAGSPDRADSVQTRALHHLTRHLDRQSRAARILYRRIQDMWADRDNVPEAERGEFESRLASELELFDRVIGWLIATADRSADLGYDPESLWVEFDPQLGDLAANLGQRVQLAVKRRDDANTQLTVAKTAEAGDESVAARRLGLQVAAQRLQTNVEALRRVIRHLERRKIDASAYRQTVVQATGEISEQLLDPEVLKGLAVVKWRAFKNWLATRGPTIFVRGLTLLAIVFLFRWTSRLVWLLITVTRLGHSSRLLRDLLGRMLLPTATLIGLIVGLWVLGVDPTTLLASVGVISVILGLALQDSLGNLAAGAFILLYRPYDVDDTVQAAGVFGSVKAMGLANTTILTFDNRRLFVPNRKIWSEVIENRSMEAVRRVDTVVRVAYGEDLERVMTVLRAALDTEDLVLGDPEPTLFVSELEKSWIEIAVRPWTTGENWWPLTTRLPRLLIEALLAEGVRVPYARRDIAILGDSAPAERRPEDPA